jgi:hypothetical protein
LCEKLNIKKGVELLESGLVKTPMVIGAIKPIVLFPIGVINHLTADQVEAVLAHELAHILRNDFAFNIIQSIIEILFYFHPAVWWISANIRAERENCCDDIAVGISGNPLTYAKALVSLQEFYTYSPNLSMSFAGIGEGDQFMNRIKRLLNQPQNKTNLREKFIATCLLLFILGISTVSFGNKTAPKEISSKSSKENQALSSVTGVNNGVAIIEHDKVYDNKEKGILKNGDKHVFVNGGDLIELDKSGKLTKLVINGKEISITDLAQHESDIARLKNEAKVESMQISHEDPWSKDTPQLRADEEQLEELFKTETYSFYNQYYESWSKCWLHDQSIRHGSGINGNSITGWNNLSNDVKEMFRNGNGNVNVKVSIRNLQATIKDNTAFVKYHQDVVSSNGFNSDSDEIRVAVKQDGIWKIKEINTQQN